MTDRIDPIELQRLIQQATAQAVKELREREKEDVGPRLREVWRSFQREVLSVSPQAGGRRDAKQFRSHMRYVLDWRFEHDGQHMALGDVPVKLIRGSLVEAWSRSLRSYRSDVTGELLGPAYINRVVNSMRTLVCFRVGRAEAHGLARVPQLRMPKPREGVFEDEKQLAEFISYLPPWLRAVATVASGPGCMRLSEALYLEKEEILWDARRIVLSARRCKSGRSRSFPVPTKTLAMLRRVADASTSPTHVFARPNGKPWSTGYAQRLFKDAADRSRIRLGPKGETVTFHYLRRTAATFRLAKDADLIGLMQEGGWESLEVAQRYQARTEQMVRHSQEMAELTVAEAMARRRLATAAGNGGGVE